MWTITFMTHDKASQLPNIANGLHVEGSALVYTTRSRNKMNRLIGLASVLTIGTDSIVWSDL